MTPPSSAGPTAERAAPWRAELLVALACLALGAISTLELHHMTVTHGEVVHWPVTLLSTMPRWLVLAATLPFVLRVGVAAAPPRLPGRRLAAHLALFLAISWAHALAVTWTMEQTSPVAHLFPWWARLIRSWYNGMPIMVSLYGAVLIAAWARVEARERERRTLRASQLEAQLQAAQLQVLRARLQPHFLYNTLHGIAALVADVQPARAVAAIEQLGELLHASLRDDADAEIPVAEEVALAGQYLALQRMRFGERLHYELAVEPAVAACPVPVMLLQPLVENAVVHGLDAGAERLRVWIAARALADGVELVVENDGMPLAGATDGARGDGGGVGLAATRARLATAYGGRAALELRPRPGGGARVRLVLPRPPSPAPAKPRARDGRPSLVGAP